MERKRLSAGIQTVILVVAVIIIAAVVFILLNRNHTAAKSNDAQTASLSSYCVGQNFTVGSSGHCVSDIQTLVNYIEDSGLTECSFANGANLTVNSTYDAATATQVTSVQRWASCYAKQEGFTSNVSQTGKVDKATWGELCTYGYTDPRHDGANNAHASILAGEDAGCAELKA